MSARNLLALLVLLFCVPVFGHADRSFAAGPERIADFRSWILVHRDGSMSVSEEIRVICEGKQIKRGIFRDFPTRYKDRNGNTFRVTFDVREVLRNGRPESYHITDLANGKRVYMGRKDTLLKPGAYTYRISYKTSRQIGFFKNFDELYWNVTGNGWSFPIDHAEAVVSLPPGTKILKMTAYTGVQGSKGQDYTVKTDGQGEVSFAATRTLLPGEGLTIAVAWPKGIVFEPTSTDRLGFLWKDNRGVGWGIIGLIVLLAFYLTAWFIVGRDPEKGTIIPLFSPPDGISPALARMIMRLGSRDDKVFAVAVVNMAVKGYLKILQGKDHVWTLEKIGSDTKGLSGGEAGIAAKLFRSGSRVKLQKTNHERIGNAQKELTKYLMREARNTYFILNSGYFFIGLAITVLTLVVVILGANEIDLALFAGVWLTIWTTGCVFLAIRVVTAWRRVGLSGGSRVSGGAGAVGITLFSLPFFAGEGLGLWLFTSAASPLAAGTLLILGFINAVFYHLLKAPTLKGRKIMDKIEGFKQYLCVAEKDRMNLLNPPEKTPSSLNGFYPMPWLWMWNRSGASSSPKSWKRHPATTAVTGRNGTPAAPGGPGIHDQSCVESGNVSFRGHFLRVHFPRFKLRKRGRRIVRWRRRWWRGRRLVGIAGKSDWSGTGIKSIPMKDPHYPQ